MENQEVVKTALPSKERFASYVKIQKEGSVNMLAYYRVFKDVMDNYGALSDLYPEVLDEYKI